MWGEALRPYRMKLLRLAPAKFIHFGTTREILKLMSGGVDEYRELGWGRLVGSSIKDSDVFCKPFLDKVAKHFWTLLHVQIGQSCKVLVSLIKSADHSLADII